MKKVLFALICMIVSGNVFAFLEIQLDSKTSKYPLSVSIYTPDQQTLIIHDVIKEAEKSTKYTLNGLLSELDSPAEKKALSTRPYMIYIKIKYAPNGDPTSADMPLYEGKIALDSVINVITTPFGKFQSIGAVKIKPSNGRPTIFEPDLKVIKDISSLYNKIK